ncbi:MAG: T9SS type A sorting domain-containing protein, partial [Bacteroidota bacterium]|nr:T9SS type A sorting domain-containing protein [Bacteroidota bacterium]
YPTVASDMITIEVGMEVLRTGTLQITDMQGRSVKAVPVRISNDRMQVEVSDLAAGQYLCSVLTNEGKAVARFIRE